MTCAQCDGPLPEGESLPALETVTDIEAWGRVVRQIHTRNVFCSMEHYLSYIAEHGITVDA